MHDRRRFLTTAVALGAGTALGAEVPRPAFAQATQAPLEIPTVAPATPLAPVSVLYAGSLVDVMEKSVARAVAGIGLRFLGEAKGSVALANEIASGLRPADVFISADTKVLDGLRGSEHHDVVTWYAVFAATRLVLGYSRNSPYAKDLAAVAAGKRSLADVLESSNFRLGRTDPELDPKGYRSIIAMRLLEKAGTIPAGAADRILGDDRNPKQILPEETLLTRLESGDVDAAFLYAVESTTRHIPVIELPASANLGETGEAKTYATVSVTIGGKTHVGAPATYAVTMPSGGTDASGGEKFVAWLLGEPGRKLLTASGVTVLRPIFTGDRAAVPPALRATLGVA